MSYQQSTDVAVLLDEIRDQLDAWVRELDHQSLSDPQSSAGHEIPDPLSEQAAESNIEFLTAMSHEELLAAAVELRAERNTLFRQLGSLPDLSQFETMRDRFEQVVEVIESQRARNVEPEATMAGQEGANAEDDDDYLDDDDGYPEDEEDYLDEDDDDEEENDEEFETYWESQKTQFLNRLQEQDESSSSNTSFTSDSTTSSPSTASEADKARLIRELKQQNAELRQQLDDKAKAEKILDADELVRQERDRLAELQHEWSTKLREAELDVSRERAEITRKAKKLEEWERTLNARQEKLDPGTNERPRKWRDFLGLS